MSSDPGSIVLDPFGGSGTTYVAAELNGRQWIGSELECTDIIERFSHIDEDKSHLQEINVSKNVLFKGADIKRRQLAGNPLSKNYRLPEIPNSCDCDKEEQ